MKNLKFTSILLLFLSLILASCTFEKRVYNKGYSVSWKKNHNTTTTIAQKNNQKEISTPEKTELLSTTLTSQSENITLSKKESAMQTIIAAAKEKAATEKANSFTNKALKNKMVQKFIEKRIQKYENKLTAPDKGGKLSMGEIFSIVAIAGALFIGLLGLIFGIIALKKLKKEGNNTGWAKALAITGIVLGALFLFIFLIWLILAITILSIF